MTDPTKDLYSIQNWGLIDYQEALQRQESLAFEIAEKELLGTIVLCQHPKVVTLGRATQPGDVFAWDGPIIEISRGGRATYHGPSQLVVYPIVNLAMAHGQRSAKDIGAYLRGLEKGIVQTLASYGVAAEGKTQKKNSLTQTSADETGVWVGQRKIASLGIAVRRWVSFHGAAINLDYDESAFQGLNPCGFQSNVMLSLEEIIGKKINRIEFSENLIHHLQNQI